MKLDKSLLLIFAMITIFFIVIVGILSRYGTKISDDPTFSTFFNWYIALVLVNLLNILITLLFHYFMTDLPGERGEKGKGGPKGLPGEDARCFCDTDTLVSGEKLEYVVDCSSLAQEATCCNYYTCTEDDTVA